MRKQYFFFVLSFFMDYICIPSLSLSLSFDVSAFVNRPHERQLALPERAASLSY